MHFNEGSIVWNIHSVLNVLTSKVISSDEISTFGWWMDHVKFETDIRCFNQRWALCSKVNQTISNIFTYMHYLIYEHVKYFDFDYFVRDSALHVSQMEFELFTSM